MTDEPSALARMPSPSAKDADADEYDVICATIMASARGRQFLQEFARRNRHADTLQMLAAITRTEDVIRERSGEPYQSFRGELLEMAKVIEALAGTVLPDWRRTIRPTAVRKRLPAFSAFFSGASRRCSPALQPLRCRLTQPAWRILTWRILMAGSLTSRSRKSRPSRPSRRWR